MAVGRQVSNSFAVEGMFGYSDIDGYPGQEHLDLSLNVLGHFAPDSAFSPYVIDGAGYLGTETTTGSEENRPSGTLGLGFRWQLGDSPVSIRGEYRARLAYERDNNLVDQIGSLSLQFSFGRASAPPAVSDSDGDGVPDGLDQCPGTAPGAVVNSVGCEADSDNDDVVDSQDVCPNTPPNVAVDSFGCRSDSDGDGVINDVDRYPNTVPNVAVDAYGCEYDDDGDSVVNRLDQCPDSAPGVRVDVNGREIREVIELRGVNFESNSDVLLPGAERVLGDAAATLQKYPDLVIEVAGHTDSDGAADFNQGLSERRAITVRDYLINAGANPANMSVRGYGEARPIADNGTAAGKAQNRRVELRILND